MAETKKQHAEKIGSRFANCGTDLQLNEEWNTADGYRVRQVVVEPSRAQHGEFIGFLEVVGYAN